MPRSLKRGLVALSSSLLLLSVGLASWVIGFNQVQAATSANSQSYCAAWDFFNNTSQDVNGLRLRLKSVKSVSSVYTEGLNPFGAPDGTSGYDAGTDTYRLNFSGATVLDSEQIQVGFCSNAPLVRLDPSGSAALWTVDGTPASPNPFFTGLEWNWLSPTHLQIRIVNEQAVTMTLSTVNLLDADTPLPLNYLDNQMMGNLALALELLSTPQDVAPNSSSFFDVFFDTAAPPNHTQWVSGNHPYVLEVTLADTNDPNNTARLYAQGLSPLLPVYLPLIVR